MHYEFLAVRWNNYPLVELFLASVKHYFCT